MDIAFRDSIVTMLDFKELSQKETPRSSNETESVHHPVVPS